MGNDQSKVTTPTSKATRPAPTPKAVQAGRVNRKVEGAFAWPGRDRTDPRAPYTFGKCSDPDIESAMAGVQYDIFGAASQRRDDSKDIINFYRIENGREQTIPRSSSFQRRAWVVGVAYNPWRVVNGSPPVVLQKLAHWGVYIRPVAADQEGPNYQIFGMNFREEFKGQLILENVWGTPGEQGTGVWKKTLSPKDFNVVQERGLEEVVMYFSFEEFVLNLQLVLWEFVRQRKSSGQGEIDQHHGEAYSLFRGNCQHFVRNVMTALKDRGWQQKGRLHRPFDLYEFERELLEKLSREIRDARPEELEYYMHRMHLQLFTPDTLNRTAGWMRKNGAPSGMPPEANSSPGRHR